MCIYYICSKASKKCGRSGVCLLNSYEFPVSGNRPIRACSTCFVCHKVCAFKRVLDRFRAYLTTLSEDPSTKNASDKQNVYCFRTIKTPFYDTPWTILTCFLPCFRTVLCNTNKMDMTPTVLAPTLSYFHYILSCFPFLGLQELDSLTDLDLTDNLLTRHSDLNPLQNLHNLCTLSLIGEWS